MNLVEILVGPIAALLGKLIPDKDARERMAHEIATMVESQTHAQVMAQMEINKQEAAHGSVFVAGWRPAIGWICGLALAWNFVLQPLLLWIVWLIPAYADKVAMAPRLDMGELMWLLTGMLGLGTMRTYEKQKGVARTTISTLE